MENKKNIGKVLLVDDEDIVLDAYQHMLEKHGFQVVPARDYAEARDRLRSGEYDAVLTDVIMDDKGGIDVLKTSMKTQPSTPVVLITGAPTVQTASTALRLGAYDYLCKPISSETLVNVAERAVAMKKVRLEKERIESDIKKYREKLEKIVSSGPKTSPPDESRWRMLFDNASDAMILSGRDGRILDINGPALELFGFTREEIAERDIGELHADEEGFRQFNTALEENRSVRDFAVMLRNGQGDVIRCLVTSLIIEDEDGIIQGCQTIIRREPDDARLEKTRLPGCEFLNHALESFCPPFMVIDVDTFQVETPCERGGPGENPASPPCCYNLILRRDQPCTEADIRCPVIEAADAAKPVSSMHPHRDSAGNESSVESRAYPLFDDQGRVRQVILQMMDVAGKTNAREELKLLDAVIRQSADAIVITRPDGTIQYANPAFEEMTGYTRDEALHKDILDLHRGLRDTGARRLFAEGGAAEPVWQGVFTSKTKDGSGFEAETAISPIRWESGEILNFVSVTKDVTRKKRLESIAEAANLMDNIGYIFSGIRHEIGNPLNSAKMTLTVLNKNLDNFPHEKIVEFMERALSEVSRMEYLLRTLKNFNMREHLEIVDFHVPRFMDSFLSLVNEDFGKKGIMIEKTIHSGVTVGRADPRALQQVMLNLLTNAADALEGTPSPRIAIDVDASRGLIRIRVKDNGAGMSDEEKNNLFKPFYTSKPHGAGLGLVIVQKMLSKMNGSISVESRKNRGAAVTILIPHGIGAAKGAMTK